MKKILILPVLAVISILFFSIPTANAADPDLAGLDNFAILSDTYTNTNPTTLTGDLGYRIPPDPITTTPTLSNGVVIASPSTAYSTAITKQGELFLSLNTESDTGVCTTNLAGATDLAHVVIPGMPAVGTLTPGIYCISGAVSILSPGIILKGDGVYIFRIDGAISTVTGSVVTLDGANPDKVFWVPSTSAHGTSLATVTTFAGNIVTLGPTTLFVDVTMNGRILSGGPNAAVTTSNDAITAPLVTIAPPIPIVESEDCVDCIPPTLGLDSNSVRRVDQGFSYNGKSSNVELFLTPLQLSTTKIGDVNKAVFKIYEAGGPNEVRHFEMIFGLAQGQILGDSKVRIELDRSWDGIDTVKVIDPEHSLKDVKVETSKGACKAAAVFTEDCLIVTVYHTFAAPLDFNIIATKVWDEHLNSWNNYFTPGVKAVDSLTTEPVPIPIIPTGMKVLISDLTITKSQVKIGDTVRVSFKVTDDNGNFIPWVTPDVGICKVSAVKPHYVLVTPKSPLANDSDCPFFQSDFLSSSNAYSINMIIPQGIKEGKYKLDVWADPDYIGPYGVIGAHKSVDITIVGGTVVPVVPTPVKIIKSPLKQVQSGTVVDDVECKEGLQFVIKASNGAPACVKPATKIILIERGWAKPQA
ncbi:ice-binding family protein [Candidatus Nitrosotenuis chungbukensis]|uniref:ice-binding family protein n=1 Tax=Candidatus Nitrosotenuis chungbukensis TaxID=1353246 RepID=UPI000694518E|nr:ice-binding family protein [Candidatus Nitrosotenuis chungbukensis]WKT57844.1 ice-binding family protein [Candidatus Nitrosotenuis chungbukensis]